MRNILNNIQPTFCCLTYNENLVKEYRGHYFLNLNMPAIDFLIEGDEEIIYPRSNPGSGDITPFSLDTEKEGYYIELEQATGEHEYQTVDLPRIFIKLETFDSTKIASFLTEVAKDIDIYVIGVDGFRPGNDYWMNETTFNFIKKLIINDNPSDWNDEEFKKYVFPNHSIDDFELNTDYWVDLSDRNDRDYSNLKWFIARNKILDMNVTEEELKNFYMTFAKIILEYANVNDPTTNQNVIWAAVLNYFKNGSYDPASIGIELILKSKYGSTYSTSCSCNTSLSSSNINAEYTTESCWDLYNSAMKEYIKNMLGNTVFYQDWFFNRVEDETYPNSEMIQLLINLIDALLISGYEITDTTETSGSCCPKSLKTTSTCSFITTVTNYRQVLEWVLNDDIDANRNKIKLYGEQFGEIFPKLIFN